MLIEVSGPSKRFGQISAWVLEFTIGFFRGRAALRDEIVDQLDLRALLRQSVGRLSKGQRKRVLLAISLLTPQPALLIAMRIRAPILTKKSSRADRVGFRPTPWMERREPGTSSAATRKNAAEERSLGTASSRPASLAPPER
jgi:hypothetical protein